MIKKEIKLRTLTPVWTGNEEGRPDGLKLSGVIGSMRYIFEALVRQAGGHTCDIINSPCNYEKDKNVCPACRVFGCTGLSRAFKVNWNLEKINKIASLTFPQEDRDARWENRTHDLAPYGNTNIDTWLASIVNGVGGTIKLGDHSRASSVLSQKINPAYSPDWSTMELVQLRKLGVPDCDLMSLLTGLLSYMADYYAIGAKVNQGWGFFELSEENASVDGDMLDELLRKIIDFSNYTKEDDQKFSNAENFPYFEEIPVQYSVNKKGPGYIDSLDFSWGSDPAQRLNFVPLGFALQYRLRRMVKFMVKFNEFCSEEELSKDESDALKEITCQKDEWAEQNPHLVGEYFKKFPDLEWKDAGAYAEYLFGSASNDKHAGYIGVSHLFKRPEDNQWRIKMISQAPDWEQAEKICELLKVVLNGGK